MAAVKTLYEGLRPNFNLAKLRRVTLTHDLDAALVAAGKRWKRCAPPGSFTFPPKINAAGCATEVMYRKRLRGEVFLDARFLAELIDPGHPKSCAANIVAHELAHVALFHWREKPACTYVFPTSPDHWRPEVLRYLTLSFWDEYAACRLAARFGHPEPVLFHFMGCLRARLANGLPRLPRTRRQHWHRRDAEVSFMTNIERIREPLLTSAYLMGHIDGLGLTTTVPELVTLARLTPLRPCWPLLHAALREVWTHTAPFSLASLEGLVPALARAVHICGGRAWLKGI